MSPLQQSFIINPGSVGLPYEYKIGGKDIRNPPWAEYGIITVESEKRHISLHHIRYDIRPLINVAHQSGMPYADWWTQDWESD